MMIKVKAAMVMYKISHNIPIGKLPLLKKKICYKIEERMR